MKYNEFLQIRETLQNELNEELLLEAPETKEIGQLDTKFAFWGSMKRKLNKRAKKVQDQVINKIISKYLPNILEMERNAAQQIADLAKQNKQPKEIMQIMYKNMGTVSANQQKIIKAIHSAIDGFVDPTQKKLDDAIDKGTMSDNRKLNLKNYWLLLCTQIKMNAFSHIGKSIQEEVAKVLGDNKDMAKYLKASDKGEQEIEKITKQYQADAEKKKQEVAAAEEQEKNNPEGAAAPGTTPAAPAALPEKGKKYKYTSSQNKEIIVTIINVSDTSIECKPDTGTPFAVKKELANKFTLIEGPKPEAKRPVDLANTVTSSIPGATGATKA